MLSRRSVITAFATLVLGFSCRTDAPVFLSQELLIEVRVYISSSFNDVEARLIQRGINVWSKATNGKVAWFVVPFDGDTPPQVVDDIPTVFFRKASSLDDWVLEWDAKTKRFLLGQCRPSGPSSFELWIVSDRLSNSQTFMNTAAHEFAHALGVKHTDDKTSIMSSLQPGKPPCLTEHDLDVLCDAIGCWSKSLTKECP